jgi:hypothetical protein
MRRLLTVLPLVCVLVLLGSTPGALADGDPASDVLLGENVFYPYSPPVSASLQHSLDTATAAAHRAGVPIKVALIGSAVDLGVIPTLFGQPQKYADFLDQEISARTKQPLLVVMPAGYGTQGLDAKSQAVVAALPRPAGGTSDQLAAAAIHAVAKLSAAAGHPISGVPGVAAASSGGSGGSSTAVVIGVVAVVIVVAGGAIIAVRRRRTATARGETATERP